MLSRLNTLYRSIFVDVYVPPKSDTADPELHPVPSSAPRYPPLDQGISLTSVSSLLDSQRSLLERIEKTAGLPHEEFDERFLPIIKNLAAYTHLLPATKTGHHRGPGGLFRLCLEMGMHALQIANATIFADKGAVTAELRFKMHPRWVYATFIAGVCAELYRPVTNMIVTDDKGDRWPSLMCPLYDWLSGRSGKYHIIWNTQDELDVVAMHQSTAAYILTSVVPKSGLQFLNQGGEVMTALTACVTNSTPQGVKNQIHQIVINVRKKVIERDLKRNSELYGDFAVGAHLEPHLIDAMRKLVKNGTWEVNVKGARIWNSSEGMFIVWQPAAREIIAVLKDQEHAGIPTEADTLADILMSCGVVEPNNQDGRYWEVCIPGSMQFLSTVKIQRAEVLFENPEDVAKVDGFLLAKNITKQSTAQPKTKAPEIPKGVEETALPVDKIKGSSPVTEKPEPAPKATEIQQTTTDVVAVAIEQPELTPQPAEPSAAGNSVADSAAVSSEAGPHSHDDVAEKIFKSLPSAVSDYLKAIVEDHRDGNSSGPVFSVDEGVAISVQELESHGQTNYTGLVKALYDKNWLWTSDVTPLLKLFDREFNGKKIKVIILRTDIARSMGFNWKQPRKGKAS